MVKESKRKTPTEKAHERELDALKFTKYKLGKYGWRCADFQSKRRYPRTGIVDMVAIKIDKKDKDRLKIMLLQVKGGSPRVKEKDRIRLGEAIKKVEVAFNCAEKPEKTVLFDWEPTDEQFDMHLA
jgi:hypothetical protein